MNKKVSIVGAGVGGLATAARLASRGFDVTVFEKLSRCGGRNHLLEDGGFKFDMGPSFVLMPDLFEELFSDCGTNIKDHLTLKELDIHYKIFYPDGETFTVHHDSEATAKEVERIEPQGAKKFKAFLKETGEIYKQVKPLLYQCFTPGQLMQPRYWPLAAKIKLFDTYWSLAKKYFKSEKLCYAFTFEAMFMGVSPFAAPAFYSIITYVDHALKISHPMGGMYRIPQALQMLAQSFNARFCYNTEISSVTANGSGMICKAGNTQVQADSIVVNADYAYAKEKLLKRAVADYQYSCSVYLMYLGLKKKIPGLAHHNLFFAKDLKANLRQIFKTGKFPDDPSFYIHVPTVTDSSLAPEGKDIVYVLIPMPNLKLHTGLMTEKEESALTQIVFDTVNRVCGVAIANLIEVKHVFYPQDFISRYNIRYGATFGLAHNLLQSAFFRPPNFDERIKNLYYVGASTQPGGGLPVVIAGSKIVADRICKGS